MPAMPRPSKKAEDIAFRILGRPANMQETTKKPRKTTVKPQEVRTPGI